MPAHFAAGRTPLCTAPPPRETRPDDLTLHTLRTLIAQNVWAPDLGDSPDVTWLDVLGEEDLAAPTWALPDGQEDPTIWVPDYEHYSGVPPDSLPPVGNLPDSWGPIGPMNRNNWRATVLTLTTRLPSPSAGWWGMRSGPWKRPWQRVGGFFPPQRGPG